MARKPSRVLSPAEKKTQLATARNTIRGLRDTLKTLRGSVRTAKVDVRDTTKILKAAEREVAMHVKVLDKAVAASKALTGK